MQLNQNQVRLYLMSNIILQCINLYKSYDNGKSSVSFLKKISFQLNEGDIAVITGKSGSGKSTLLHLIAGLDMPNSGQILFNSKLLNDMSSNEIAKLRNKKLGFIYQFHHLLLDFTVLENISMPLLIDNKTFKESKEISYKMLKILNLEDKRNKYPSELSGGERQRVAIARALINQPSLVIADEPTNNLDLYNKNIILNLIFELNNQLKTSFLIATHDFDLIKKTPILFKMKNGQLLNYKKRSV